MKPSLLLTCVTAILFAVSCKGPDGKQGNTPPDTPLTVNVPAAAKPDASMNNGVYSTAEYQISIPTGWEQKDQLSNNYKLVMLVAPRVDNYSPNLNILKDDMKGKELDGYIRLNLEKMATMNLTNQKNGDLVIDGVKGKFLTYNYTIEGRNIAIKTYVIPKNGVAYVLTGSCLESQAATYQKQFDDVANTFKLK
ncbi:hypothetical protein [Mucilaginibacter glaciei]|uniref:PsbP C-terminal domain-containing protein n=1 Tax=Mucilaginibacter glaciei TaxID=2772109 RepID=A0A926NQX4_9SPHI|nr:hypothetical protein [Mucilaginibacter glaciei]MBD1392220.1 hypothetical protein [Mucilaginibacter glaciei]